MVAYRKPRAHAPQLGQGGGYLLGWHVLERLEHAHEVEAAVRPGETGDGVSDADVAARPGGGVLDGVPAHVAPFGLDAQLAQCFHHEAQRATHVEGAPRAGEIAPQQVGGDVGVGADTVVGGVPRVPAAVARGVAPLAVVTRAVVVDARVGTLDRAGELPSDLLDQAARRRARHRHALEHRAPGLTTVRRAPGTLAGYQRAPGAQSRRDPEATPGSVSAHARARHRHRGHRPPVRRLRGPSTASTSRSPRARSTASWAPTAPASRPWCACCAR